MNLALGKIKSSIENSNGTEREETVTRVLMLVDTDVITFLRGGKNFSGS
jgi:hypothetical protein